MSKRITGRAIIYVDGKTIPSENGATLNPGGESKKPERHGGVTYYTTEEVPPSVECRVNHTADVDILALSNMENVTVLFECDTGQKYLIRGGTTQDPVPVDTSSGKSALTIFGNECVKV